MIEFLLEYLNIQTGCLWMLRRRLTQPTTLSDKLQQHRRVAHVGLARFRSGHQQARFLPARPGNASRTMRRFVHNICIAQYGNAPFGSFHSNQSWYIRTEPVRPCCSTENRFPNIVVRSTFTVLAGMRQPLVRFSWMRRGSVHS